VFGATLKDTVPFPTPLLPLTSVIQSTFDVADHAHVAADAVTAAEPEPPVSETFCEVGAIVHVHGGGAADCVTVKVRPAMFRLPVRAPPLVFAATVNATVPLPAPERPLVIVIQLALDDAFHEHVLPAVTSTVPLPPSGATDSRSAAMEYVQGAPA
jgi:hypothetical protein